MCWRGELPHLTVQHACQGWRRPGPGPLRLATRCQQQREPDRLGRTVFDRLPASVPVQCANSYWTVLSNTSMLNGFCKVCLAPRSFALPNAGSLSCAPDMAITFTWRKA